MLLDYQQKRFGSTGDLITQKAVLVKPIQDQVFTAVQDISTQQKYDFIFDKSSDLTILFAAKQHNISDKVVRALTRSSKREQLSKKQLKEELAKEAKEDMVDDNPELAERAKLIEDKKAAREKLLEDRKAAAAERKLANDAKRAQALADREALKNGTKASKPEEGEKETSSEGKKEASNAKKEDVKEETGTEISETKKALEDKKAEIAAERQRKLDERKAALEEKRKKILADREAAKQEREGKKTPSEEKTEDKEN